MTLLFLFNFVRTLLIIVGVFFVLRLVGRMMVAKRNMEEQERLNREINKKQRIEEEAKRNFGRTSVSKIGKDKYKDSDFVDFEEIDE